MSLTAIIFDMDGLMVDTEPLSRQAWEQVIAPFGYRLADDVYGRMVGLRLDQSVRVFLNAYPLPLSAEETRARRNRYYRTILARGVPIMPGLMELQAEISRRHLPWAVATSSPRRHAQQILAQLGLQESCQAIVGGDEVPHGKPAPDIYLLAAERLGVLPRRCLALEDSAPGCRAAAQAGMAVVAVPNRVTETAVFPCAHHIFKSLSEVITNLPVLLGN